MYPRAYYPRTYYCRYFGGTIGTVISAAVDYIRTIALNIETRLVRLRG